MNKAKLAYFEKEDILHLSLTDGPEEGSVEVTPNVTAELNAEGDLIGIEILNPSDFIRDAVVESVQGRLLNLTKAKTA